VSSFTHEGIELYASARTGARRLGLIWEAV